MKLLTVVQLVYGIPSFLLLCFFFGLPFRYRKKLSNPFYRLLQIDIFVNITCYINTWISLRLESFETGMRFLVFLETSIPGVLTLSRVLVTAYFHMQNVTGLSLVAYRFTSVLFLRSEQYWNRWYFLVPICGVVYSFAVISPWWLFNNYTGTVEIRNGTIYKNVNEKAMFTQATISPIFSTFYFLMILLIGVWTTMAIEDRGKKSQSSRHRHFVKKLTRVIVCNSILMSGNLLFLIILSVIQIFYRPAALVPIKSVVVTFTSDMVTLPMPYILFAFDSNVRRILRIDKVPNLSERLNTYTAKTITNYAIS